MRLLNLILILSLGFCRTLAQDLASYTHKEWTTDDGLPQNTVLSLVQTWDGYIWAATYEGVVRYNGTTFTVFEPETTPGLPGKSIITLFESSDSTLWVGSRTGLAHFKNGQFFLPEKLSALGGRFIRSFAESQDGTIWIGLDDGLAEWKDETLRIFHMNDGLISETIQALSSGADGSLWIGTPVGLVRKTGNQFFTYSVGEGLPNQFVRTIIADHNGVLWVGTSGGVVRIIGNNLQPAPSSLRLNNPAVSALLSAPDGSVWFATDMGINRFDGTGNSVFTTQDGLSTNRTRCLLADKEGTVWVGTNLGLNQLRKGRFTVLTEAKGLSDDYVRTVMEDSKGTIWIGTSSGLNEWKQDAIRKYSTSNGLSSNEVLALAEAPDGSIWIGTVGGGVSILKNNRFSFIKSNQGLLSDNIRAIYADKDGTMWIGTTRGLNRYRNGQMVSITNRNGLTNNFILSITRDSSGDLLVGTSNGLNRITPDELITPVQALPDRPLTNVFTIYADSGGISWAGTDNGLYFVLQDTVIRISRWAGLFDNVVFSILPDGDGNFWMTCNKGVFKVSRRELLEFAKGTRTHVVSESFGKSDGLKTSQFNGSSQPAGWKATDGKLLLPTAKGLAILDPANKTSDNKIPPPVIIESVYSVNIPVAVSDLVKLDPGNKRFEFRFAVLSYIEPEKIQCRYRLSGYDEEWISAGNQRSAMYTNLPPGNYTFHVIAANSHGYWNHAGASMAISIEPLFYQSPWFIGLVISLLAVALGAGHFYRITQLKMNQRLLISTVDERTRIIREEKRKSDEAGEALKQKSEALQIALNQLKQTQFQLIQNEKMASLGQLTAGLAHELNNPMNFITSAIIPLQHDIELLVSVIEKLRSPEFAGLINQINLMELEDALHEIPVLFEGISNGARRTESIVSSFRRFARLDEDIPKKINLKDCIETTIQVVAGNLKSGHQLIRNYSDVPEMECYPGQINQLLMNLLINAADSMPSGGPITVSLRMLDDYQLELAVSDEGEGIPDSIKDRIFEPFFSTKAVGDGSGLGLFVVYGIVQRHKGTLTVDSKQGKGTTFRVVFDVRNHLF